METVEGLERYRRALAARLREIRVASGVNGSEAARILGWSQPRVSRIETGRVPPTEEETRTFARTFGASSEVIEELVASAQALNREWTDIRSLLARGSQQRQNEVQEIEVMAKSIRSFGIALIPGLLQTSAYRRALAELRHVFSSEAEIKDDLAIQRERQKGLRSRGKQFSFLLTEPALANRYGGAAMMRQQCEQILALFDLPRVNLGVIPRDALLPVVPATEFTIFDNSLVTIETFTSEVVLRFPDDVTEYQKIFDKLTGCAVAGKRAKKLIEEVRDSFL